METIAEILRAISVSIFIISSAFYFRHLDKTKKQRKLAAFENAIYVLIQTAFLLFAVSLLLFFLQDERGSITLLLKK